VLRLLFRLVTSQSFSVEVDSIVFGDLLDDVIELLVQAFLEKEVRTFGQAEDKPENHEKFVDNNAHVQVEDVLEEVVVEAEQEAHCAGHDLSND
jgi:hypothetical protein